MRLRFAATALWIAALCGPAAAEITDVTLIDGRQPLAALVLPPHPHEDEELAALELREHLRRMSGVELPLVEGHAPDGLVPVRLGLELRPEAEQIIRTRSDDRAAFLLEVTAEGVTLAGLTPEGTLFAAYELLEQLGCRWYMPGELGTVVPRRTRVTAAAQRTVRFPSFAARNLQAVTRALPWYRRQRLGGDWFPGAHGIPLEPPAALETEPELFALVDGRRVSGQLCVGHPEVVRRATAAVIAYFEEHPERPWVGLGPDDGRGFCEDERCRALDGGEWDPHAAGPSMTDRYVWLFNRILEGMEERFPDKRIGFYAYDSYKLPPRRVKPDPRIVPAFAPITLCRLHGLDNPVCPDRSFYKSLMRRWGELVPEVFERGYYFNLADPGFPFSKVHALRQETPFAHGAGISGWRVECMPAWSAHTPTLYVAARLMWDVDTDVDALLREFYSAFFGPAAEPMGAYLASIDRAYRDTDCHAGSSHCLPRVFDDDWRGRAAGLLAEAAALAEGAHAERVRIYALAHARLEAFLAMLASRDAFDFAAARGHLQQVRALTDTMLAYPLAENAHLLWPRIAHSYLDRFWSPAVEQAHERAVERGELVAPLPEVWDFLIDPAGVGESLGWFREGEIGGNWQPLHTSTASWSEQGLHYYKGAAWYRTQVEVPAASVGRRIHLFFGSVDEQARVWVNGRLLGDSPGRSFMPFEFDATAALRPGANTVAVRIVNVELNEIGTGGITAPVMLWSPTE